MNILRIITIIAVVIVALIGVGWLGIKFNLGSFQIPSLEVRDLGSVEAPSDLPAPVARFVQVAFADELPVIESALVVGKADLTFNGITFPGRFKFYYEAGSAYYHYIQLGWFGQPIFTVNERNSDGVTILDIPGNYIEDNAKVNAAANQGLWAEGIWMPSIWFTDERVRWKAIDDTTARLILKDAADEEMFEIQFDPQTGLISSLTTLRYQNPDSTERIRWTSHALQWQEFNGMMIPSLSDLQWGTDKPWVKWHIENVYYNVDVSGRMAQFGGSYKD